MKFFPQSDAWAMVQAIDVQGAVCVPECINESERLHLLQVLSRHPLIKQPEVIGSYNVRQNFSSFGVLPESEFWLARNELLAGLRKLFAIAQEFRSVRIFPQPLYFNEGVVQQYEPSMEGVSPHRDGVSMINLIAILVLEGKGNFYLCDDRSGTNPRSLRNEPGDLLLMRGVGFLGSTQQPFHSVGRVEERRTTLAFRQKELGLR